MRAVIVTLLALVLLIVGGFLHYTLPQRDVVRIVNTEIQRIDQGRNSIFWAQSDAGSGTAASRDIRFIETFRPNGRPMIYRNEDTGWGWPPYFKFDSANVQAEARDLVSTAEAPQWAEIKHYGWRNQWLSIYPNAISIRRVAGPDVGHFPFFNVLFFLILAVLAALIWRSARRFRSRRVDPFLDDIDEASAEGRARARGWWRRISGR